MRIQNITGCRLLGPGCLNEKSRFQIKMPRQHLETPSTLGISFMRIFFHDELRNILVGICNISVLEPDKLKLKQPYYNIKRVCTNWGTLKYFKKLYQFLQFASHVGCSRFILCFNLWKLCFDVGKNLLLPELPRF